MSDPVQTPTEAISRGLTSREWRLCFSLYLVQGIPIGLAFQALPVLLQQTGLNLTLIAFVPIVSLPWIFKPLWAPFVENHYISHMGRRRSWILPLQISLAIICVLMSLDPLTEASAGRFLGYIFAAGLVSATQDIATDGLIADLKHQHNLRQVNILQVAGFMSGMIVGGAGLMALVAETSLASAFIILALVVSLCCLPILTWQEMPPTSIASVKANWLAFFKRPQAVRFLGMGMCATMGGAGLFSLSRLLLTELDFPLLHISLISGFGNSVMVIIGCVALWWLGRQQNLRQLMVWGLFLLAISICLWLMMTQFLFKNEQMIIWTGWLAVFCTGSSIGIVTVASYALLMRFAQQGNQAGTDYAFFQSSQIFGEAGFSVLATSLAASWSFSVAILASFVPLSLCLLLIISQQDSLAKNNFQQYKANL